jgi:proteasome accessory factor B
MNTAKPRTPDFEVPADFSLDAHVAHYPWQHRFHPPLDVELELSGELAARAESLLPGAPVVREGGIAHVRVTTTFTDGLLRFCLQLGPDCRVRAPESARLRLREMAERVLQRHADAETGAEAPGAEAPKVSA